MKNAGSVAGMLFGTFDGVHIGHVWLIESARKKIERLYGSNARLCIVVGRDRVVRTVKGAHPYRTEHDRVAALKALFPECTIVLGHQTRRTYWVEKLQPSVIFLGYDQMAFVPLLRTLLKKMRHMGGQRARIVRLNPFRAGVYKSSKVRGGYYVVRGEVVHGKKLARSVGYPTANVRLSVRAKKDLLQSGLSGIYASRALVYAPNALRVSEYIAATVIGARMHNGAPLVETHLIGFTGECYGAHVSVSVEKKLRPFRAYISPEALAKDIQKDIADVKRFFTQVG